MDYIYNSRNFNLVLDPNFFNPAPTIYNSRNFNLVLDTLFLNLPLVISTIVEILI